MLEPVSGWPGANRGTRCTISVVSVVPHPFSGLQYNSCACLTSVLSLRQKLVGRVQCYRKFLQRGSHENFL